MGMGVLSKSVRLEFLRKRSLCSITGRDKVKIPVCGIRKLHAMFDVRGVIGDGLPGKEKIIYIVVIIHI